MTRRHARCTGVADEARYLPLIVPAMRHPRGRGAFPAGAALDAAARGVVHGAALRYRPRPAVYQQGRTGSARELLAPIYRRFTEGFDTAELQAAKTLLGGFG